MHLTAEDGLRETLETAFIHCQPGGVVLVMPNFVQETMAPLHWPLTLATMGRAAVRDTWNGSQTLTWKKVCIR